MNIVQRVKSLGLPLDKIVIIGSGVMDALNLRQSTDIDIAADTTLFNQLRASGRYSERYVHGEIVLEREDVEIWQNWGDDLPYQTLQERGITIDGIRFCNPGIVLLQKQARLQPKDYEDIVLLRSYLNKTA